jgi:hypothetical protein
MMNRKLIIKPSRYLGLCAYVDASFAIHADSNCYSGIIILVPEAVVYVSKIKKTD